MEAARPWAIEFTPQHHWPIAVATFKKNAVVVRFSTIPDSPMSPFHGTINSRLDLLSRALGRAYLAFCSENERDFLLDLLEVKDEERQRILGMLARVRKVGFAMRDPRVDPRAAEAVRSHWAIENSLHWVLDVTFSADQSRLRTGHGAKNMAIVRHFAINLVRAVDDKRSIKLRRKCAGWDLDDLAAILGQLPR